MPGIGGGVTEKFSVIVNPEKIGTLVSAFFDVEVDPQGIERVAEDFVRRNPFSRRHVVKANCKLPLSRVKNRRRGPRI